MSEHRDGNTEWLVSNDCDIEVRVSGYENGEIVISVRYGDSWSHCPGPDITKVLISDADVPNLVAALQGAAEAIDDARLPFFKAEAAAGHAWARAEVERWEAKHQ